MKNLVADTGIEVSQVELVYRKRVDFAERPRITCSRVAYDILMKSWDQQKIQLQEHFKVLYLNSAGYVLGVYHLSEGGHSATIADPKMIFATGLQLIANSIILAHNHPSDSTKPSSADIELTYKVKNAAALLDMKLYDHLILTPNRYLSFADEGLL